MREVDVKTARAPSFGLPLRFIIAGMVSLLTTVVMLFLRPDVLSTYHYNQHVIAITHLLVLGFILSIVSGTLYHLVPVAFDTTLFSERLGHWHFVSHLIGFIGMVWMFWIWDMKQVGHFGSILAFGTGLFVYNIAKTLRSIPRWDAVAFAVASSLVWLSMTVLAGLYLAAAKCWTFSPFFPIAAMHAHAHLGAIGVFVMLIVGISYRIIPMFVLGDLQSHRRAIGSIALLNIGLAGLFITVLIEHPWKLGFALVLITGLTVYGIELVAILVHRRRRAIDWNVRTLLTAIALLIPLSVLAIVLCWPGLPATLFTTQLENVYGFLGLFGIVTLAIIAMLPRILPVLVWSRRHGPGPGQLPAADLAQVDSAPVQILAYWLYLAGLVAVSLATALAHENAVRWSTLLLAASIILVASNMIRSLLIQRRTIRQHRMGNACVRLDLKSRGDACSQQTAPV